MCIRDSARGVRENMEENIQLTAEVFIDTGKDFRPEDSLTVPYACIPGEPVTLEFDLSVFEHTCGFRFDPLLEDSSMVRLDEIALTYEDGETKAVSYTHLGAYCSFRQALPLSGSGSAASRP